MGCCFSPAAEDGASASARHAPAEDDTFYDCEECGDYVDLCDAPEPSSRGAAADQKGPASEREVSPWPDLPLPCEPLDDDDEVPPLPAGTDISQRDRQAALTAMRAAVMAPWDTEIVSPWEDRSPATLERFLRARDYDVPVASTLYLEHRAWRRQLGWRVPASAVPAEHWAHQKICLQALSVDGRPLLIIVVRRHTMAGRDMDAVRAFIVHTMDRIFDAMRPGGQFLVLVDFKGLSRTSADLKALIACFEILQKFYVERVKHLWFVEPPTLFWAIWKAVQPFVAPKTRAKIVFLYGQEVASTLLTHFKPEDVPAEYGGTGLHRPISPGNCVWETLPGAPRRRKY